MDDNIVVMTESEADKMPRMAKRGARATSRSARIWCIWGHARWIETVDALQWHNTERTNKVLMLEAAKKN